MLFLVLSGILVVTLLLGQWTAFALGTTGAAVLLLSKGPLGLLAISSVVWNASNSYILIAVPMFLLMGEIIQRSGAGQHFYAGVAFLLGRLPGGLLHANILSCAIFAAVSGSSVATAATVGTVAIPEMRKRGYDARMVFGSLAAGGTLGILIPPSIIMVLYGALVEESVAKLFMAGVLPGLLMAALFMVYIAVRLLLDRSLAPTVEDRQGRARARQMLHILPVTTLLIVVLGGIYSGVATPTEAAALGAAGALILAAAYRSLTRKVFWDSVMATVRTTCMVSLILISAQVLSTGLTFSGASRGVSDWVLSLGLDKWSFFAVLVVLYLVLGCFVDGISDDLHDVAGAASRAQDHGVRPDLAGRGAHHPDRARPDHPAGRPQSLHHPLDRGGHLVSRGCRRIGAVRAADAHDDPRARALAASCTLAAFAHGAIGLSEGHDVAVIGGGVAGLTAAAEAAAHGVSVACFEEAGPLRRSRRERRAPGRLPRPCCNHGIDACGAPACPRGRPRRFLRE